MSSPPVSGEMPKAELARVYVWELPVRIAHWVIAGSIVVLSVTGMYMGKPMDLIAPGHRTMFVMGWTRAIHFYAAIAFVLGIVTRIAWMFLGNRYSHWDKFLPVTRVRRKGILPTLRFYLFALQKPPGFVGHNPLAGMTYSLVFVLYFIQIATGFALYSSIASVHSPMRVFGFLLPLYGGLQTARFIHHIIMWLLLGFAVHHVYSSILMSTVDATGTVESIFSGHKFVPPEDMVYSGYRFRRRRTLDAIKKAQAARAGGR